MWGEEFAPSGLGWFEGCLVSTGLLKFSKSMMGFHSAGAQNSFSHWKSQVNQSHCHLIVIRTFVLKIAQNEITLILRNILKTYTLVPNATFIFGPVLSQAQLGTRLLGHLGSWLSGLSWNWHTRLKPEQGFPGQQCSK